MSAFVCKDETFSKIIKGLLINPETQTIEEVDVNFDSEGSCLHSMYKHLNCSCVDVSRQLLSFLPNCPCDDVWFDDEGLYSGNKYMFLIPGFVPLIGRGLILSYNNLGDCESHTLTAEDIDVLRKSIRWLEKVVE